MTLTPEQESGRVPPLPPTIARALTVPERTGAVCVNCCGQVDVRTRPTAVHDMFGNRWKVRFCSGCGDPS
ncbi:hypothetical protein FHU37_004685 [Allostreptomyces psammosilenae]|uniref:Uncharacterized protein n=1 Tax=Allostreptomyces psammosilenae TaxID=1892865 RepID=A0A852ZZ95_9ACTN|nr:hypothetical protein [Allostreptomyces psammosilenae]